MDPQQPNVGVPPVTGKPTGSGVPQGSAAPTTSKAADSPAGQEAVKALPTAGNPEPSAPQQNSASAPIPAGSNPSVSPPPPPPALPNLTPDKGGPTPPDADAGIFIDLFNILRTERLAKRTLLISCLATTFTIPLGFFQVTDIRHDTFEHALALGLTGAQAAYWTWLPGALLLLIAVVMLFPSFKGSKELTEGIHLKNICQRLRSAEANGACILLSKLCGDEITALTAEARWPLYLLGASLLFHVVCIAVMFRVFLFT